MTFAAHVRLGPYEVVGAGGMGEVYRARDTRLDRTVAIKQADTLRQVHVAVDWLEDLRPFLAPN